MPGAVLGFHGGIHNSGYEIKIKKDDNELSVAMKKTFQKLLKTETALFKKMRIDHQIVKDSFDLTKVKERPAVITIEVNGETFTFGVEQQKEVAKLLNDLEKEGKVFDYSVTSASEQSQNKVYFPSKETLMNKYRVKGISNYPYPSNQDEADKLAKEMANALEIENGFVIVGEFSSEKK